ncbi:MAG: SDR family oxidoreductase [Armatimonadetes bacterium]|nr:SDR family oxidoreductase [Armatimonadota bacterium]
MPSPEPVAIVTHWDGTAGPEIILSLANQGFRVVAPTTEENLLMIGAPETVMSIELDPGHEASVKEKFAGVVSLFGRIDVLVNNPMVWNDAALAEITETMWAEVITQNTKATFYCARAAAAVMQARGGGRIINITSTAGLSGAHTQFAVSCAGILSLTRSLAIELAPSVRVNCIATGLMDEPWIDEAGADFRQSLESKIPLSRLCRGADVAEFVGFLASSGDYFTAQTFTLDGGEFRR